MAVPHVSSDIRQWRGEPRRGHWEGNTPGGRRHQLHRAQIPFRGSGEQGCT